MAKHSAVCQHQHPTPASTVNPYLMLFKSRLRLPTSPVTCCHSTCRLSIRPGGRRHNSRAVIGRAPRSQRRQSLTASALFPPHTLTHSCIPNPPAFAGAFFFLGLQYNWLWPVLINIGSPFSTIQPTMNAVLVLRAASRLQLGRPVRVYI